MVSSIQIALLLSAPRQPFVLDSRPVPAPGPKQVLIKIHAAALNPIDGMIRDSGFAIEEWPAVAGSDGAGEVVATGNEVGSLKIGDRVLFHCWYVAGRGTFQEYALSDASRTTKIPDSLTYEEASTIPLAFHTAALGLYGVYDINHKGLLGRGLKLPIPIGKGAGRYKDQPILITGGSSSVGQFAIQLAKLSGFNPIITTSSKANESYCLSAGATHVIDYKYVPYASLSSYITTHITTKQFHIIYDAISDDESQTACWSLLSEDGGRMCIVHPPAKNLLAEVDEKWFAKGKGQGGKTLNWVFGSANGEGTMDDGDRLAVALEEWLRDGKIKPNKVELLPGGLTAVEGNVGRFSNGGVSAAKLVIRIAETPAQR